MARRVGSGNGLCKTLVVAQEIILRDLELKVKDIEELPLDAPDIPLSEYAGTHGPMNVLQGRVVKIL